MEEKHIRIHLTDDGTDVYAPCEGQRWGYRYGPSIMQYGGGRLDAWFASPGCEGEADWFTWRHSEDDGRTWSDEVVVMYPTQDSMDDFSVCDPGVIYLDGWYYIGYTSTIYADGGGVCNNGFVARSRRPDGPFVKWTGTGWGETRKTIDENGAPLTLEWQGRPAPIIYFDEPWQNWGAGELSMVKKGNTLFLYSTWWSTRRDGEKILETRVATADLTAGDNWPATVTPRGVAIRRPDGATDSCDVIYVDGAEKFVILTTARRFSDESCLAVYESDDGLTFTLVQELRSHVGAKCHNCGIAGGPDRHVSLQDTITLGYAYGSLWGFWGTRFHKATLSLGEGIDLSEREAEARSGTVIPRPILNDPWPIHLACRPHLIRRRLSDGPMKLELDWLDSCYRKTPCPEAEVTVDGYDPAVIRFEGLTCIPVAVGESTAVAHFGRCRLEILIQVPEESVPVREGDCSNHEPRKEGRTLVSFEPIQTIYRLPVAEKLLKQVRGLGRYDDESWYEVFKTADGVTCSGYDETLLEVREDSVITDKGVPGVTPLTLSCNGMSFTVQVEILA